MDDLDRLSGKRERLSQRDLIQRAARSFFHDRGFLEVSTPLLSFSVIPEEHIDLLESEAGFLLPSPEVHMKPLLASGFERIFQIGPRYRRGERGAQHLPEFTLLEWYRAHADYQSLAMDSEELVLFLHRSQSGGSSLTYQGTRIDLLRPWPRLTVRTAFRMHAGWDPWEDRDPERFEWDFAEKVIPGLDPQRPVFLVDFPAYEASLARRKPGDPETAERIELFIGGLELANGFSELVDPQEQRMRFERANEKRRSLGRTGYPLPQKFLESLRRMPPSAGIALGFDRLVMLLTDSACIDQVVAFAPEDL